MVIIPGPDVMCGIVGIFNKNKELNGKLGEMLGTMLVQMSERGPDSAGVAVYGRDVPAGHSKLTLFSSNEDFDWSRLGEEIATLGDAQAEIRPRASHAVVTTSVPRQEFIRWLQEQHAGLQIMSAGNSIEIYKEKGLPRDFTKRFRLDEFEGSHALGHTRMATESAVTTEHSHPFSTGMDLCLVHNGSLSNHNRLREKLRTRGIDIQTDNDSEVAAGYLMWRMAEGDNLEEALHQTLEDLDGFYTFAIGTHDGFAVLRDPIACKPAVMAETDDWVAMSSEFRAIAQLPGVDNARIWEPEPATVYYWGAA